MAIPQNAIKFLGFNVTNVVFDRPHGFHSGDFQINIEHICNIQAENKNLFQIVFIVTISGKENQCYIQVKAIADFEAVGEVSEEIYQSFVNVNAPAIAYPYLRAFVSNIVLQAGMAPIILPPVNFTKANNPSEKK